MRRWKSLAGMLCLVSVCAAYAEEETAEEEVADTESEGISISGYIETSFTANLANPPGQDDKGNPIKSNVYFPYFPQPLSFHLGTVHLSASGETNNASYVVDIDTGTVAKGNNAGAIIDLQEAYLTYDFGSLSLTAGKFASFEGIELIESPSNPVITHGLLYWLAEPLYHVGAYAAVPIGEKFEARLGVVNGWDQLHDELNDKTLLGRLGGDYGYLSWGLSGTYGKEYSVDPRIPDENPRLSLDLTGALEATDQLTIGFQGNFGNEEVDGETLAWMGAGLQPVYSLSDEWALSGRFEFFKDDGFRSGTEQTLLSFTGSVGYLLGDTTRVRVEGRLDSSDQEVFLDADGKGTKSQLTATVQLVQTF